VNGWIATYFFVGLAQVMFIWGRVATTGRLEHVLEYARSLPLKARLLFWWNHGPALVFFWPLSWTIYFLQSPQSRENMLREVRRTFIDGPRMARALRPELPAAWTKLEVLRVAVDSDEFPLPRPFKCSLDGCSTHGVLALLFAKRCPEHGYDRMAIVLCPEHQERADELERQMRDCYEAAP
jgi:hypothetical protein